MSGKRKADSLSDISVAIDTSKARVQPVLATFSAAIPPPASSFTTYRSTEKQGNYIVVSENDKIEYVGKTFDGDRPLVRGCNYLLGVYDPQTNSVTFRQAPLVRIDTTIKALKGSRGVSDRDISDRIMQAHTELGEAFGSKKRKAQIRADERNRINMEGVKNDMKMIGASIESRASSMPSKQELTDAQNSARPVPRYNPDTKVPAEIYDMDDVLPKSTAAFIDISPLLASPTDIDVYREKVPTRSGFVKSKLSYLLNQPKPDILQIKRALYLAYLIRMATMRNKQLADRDACLKSLCCSPEMADALFSKFAECVAGSVNPDGSPVYIKTTAMENKLICYISVLVLSLNGWVAYPSELAGDLGIQGKKAERYLASVGCKLEAVSASEIAAHTSNKRSASRSGKKAVLKAPIQFPKPSLRRA
ncbi:DNA-directed RNA polymerase I subunit rpa49 [Coemansia sp. RSA 1290]|nr:DNA-directed RNA polymerase I subunit rpa49 [Coemansia sp. RSA 1290]KAJ2650210.1 DNA-directed RNA polymerase I subunit rpa49 [Coemansia sp. RSA 1250]KAJ2670237.1 DNA-directed RNA polymerase I subunit rpa49 [Coemansia sp. RSA 1085]